ncbi:MAG: hypothetical protein V7640_676, partial [Betaproteobacteria bacterium]
MLTFLSVCGLSIVAMVVGTGIAVAQTSATSVQTYPNKPIRIVTPEIGGSQDVAARILSQAL